MTKNVLLLGFGYTAQYISNYLLKTNDSVSATTRAVDKLMQWQQSAVTVVPYHSAATSSLITTASHILVSTPPNADSHDPVLIQFTDQLISNNHLVWVGYLSATSVYGDHQGKWVNETSATNHPGPRGTRRLKVEKEWLTLWRDYDLPVHIFRLAGIYGPKRNSLERILHGKDYSILKQGQVFSRIHVTDISRALLVSMNDPTPGAIYNLADDYPTPSHEVDAYAAKLLRVPVPRLISFDQVPLSLLAREFYRDCRKISNEKFKTRFNFELLYPSYQQGLEQIYTDMLQETS